MLLEFNYLQYVPETWRCCNVVIINEKTHYRKISYKEPRDEKTEKKTLKIGKVIT